MPVAVFRDAAPVPMGERLTVDSREGTLVGVNSSGTIRVRFDDTGEDEEVDPAEVSLTVEAV